MLNVCLIIRFSRDRRPSLNKVMRIKNESSKYYIIWEKKRKCRDSLPFTVNQKSDMYKKYYYFININYLVLEATLFYFIVPILTFTWTGWTDIFGFSFFFFNFISHLAKRKIPSAISLLATFAFILKAPW